MRKTLEMLHGGLSRLHAVIGLVGLTLIACAIVADVIMRLLFSKPIEGIYEVISLMSAVIVASFLPLSFALRSHASIRIMHQFFGRRGEMVFDQFAAMLSLAFLVVFTWQMGRYANELATSGQSTWVLELEPAPWWYLATGLIGLAAFVQFLGMLLAVLGSGRSGQNP